MPTRCVRARDMCDKSVRTANVISSEYRGMQLLPQRYMCLESLEESYKTVLFYLIAV